MPVCAHPRPVPSLAVGRGAHSERNGDGSCPSGLLCPRFPGVLRPRGILAAGWQGHDCCCWLPASCPCPRHTIRLRTHSLSCSSSGSFPGSPRESHTFLILRDGKWQPWVGGHPGGAERSHWGVLIEGNLWAGSSDVLVQWDPMWALPASKLSFLLVEWLMDSSGP